MNLFPIILVAGGIGILAFVNKRTKTAGKLQFEPLDFKVTGSFPYYKVTLRLSVTNPTSTPLEVNSIFLDVTTGSGKVIGKIQLNDKLKIEAKKENFISVPVKVMLGNAIAEIITMVIAKKPVELKLIGIINSMGIDIEVNENLPVSI